jgi:hypothetical protein
MARATVPGPDHRSPLCRCIARMLLANSAAGDRDPERGGGRPLDDEAVGGHAGVEVVGAQAVHVLDVAASRGAELCDIEVGVTGLQGVERPGDNVEAKGARQVALGEGAKRDVGSNRTTAGSPKNVLRPLLRSPFPAQTPLPRQFPGP